MRPFNQIDVFTETLTHGNALAVVHQAEGLHDEQLAAFARWTNLSETAFLLPPTRPGADYRVRIFTPESELPFAGHPTLGSARAWLEAGGEPAGEVIIQECTAGLIRIRRCADRLAFAAPPLRRSGPVEQRDLDQISAALGVPTDQVLDASWVDNGPGWLGLLLRDADTVLALRPDFAALRPYKVGVIGPGGAADFEVRAFAPSIGVPEDPVTGSLNAGLAQWLIGAGHAPSSHVAAQGQVVGRAGRVHLDQVGDDTWVGGQTVVGIMGTVQLGPDRPG